MQPEHRRAAPPPAPAERLVADASRLTTGDPVAAHLARLTAPGGPGSEPHALTKLEWPTISTLTVVPVAGNLRIAVNRDALRTQPPAAPPAVIRAGSRRAIRSHDPDSNSEWFAATDAGLVFAVLEAITDRRLAAEERRSTGRIIPAVLPAATPLEAVRMAERSLDGPAFTPFRFVAIGPYHIAGIWWDGERVTVESQLIGGRPAVFTAPGPASDGGAGDRTELFGELLAGPPSDWPAAQVAFHCHRWPERLGGSVNMTRADARTVSYTVVERGGSGLRVRHHPDAPHMPAEDIVCELPYAGAWRPPAGHGHGQ